MPLPMASGWFHGRKPPAGIRMVQTAPANGSRTAYDEIEDLANPPDLASALTQNPAANACFGNFPGASRKNILRLMKSARKPETGAARIYRTVELPAEKRLTRTRFVITRSMARSLTDRAISSPEERPFRIGITALLSL